MKVAPEDILKVQFPRFTTLDLRPTNTDISMAVAGLLTFFNSSTSCLICAQADCEYHGVFVCIVCVCVYVHIYLNGNSKLHRVTIAFNFGLKKYILKSIIYFSLSS